MAKVTIGLDDTQLTAGISRSGASLQKFAAKTEQSAYSMKSAMTRAFAFTASAGVAVATLRNVAGRFDEISDAADKMGESTDVIQRVGFAAAQSGSSIDEVASSFLRLEKSLGDVENSGAREALANLGITAESLSALPLDQKILVFAAAFEKARASGTGVNDIMTLLGKSAGNLIPLFSQGEDAIKGMLQDAPVLASEAVDALSLLNDEMDRVGNKATVVGGQMLAGWGLIVEAIGKMIEEPSRGVMGPGGILDELGKEMNDRAEAADKRRENARKSAMGEDDTGGDKKAAAAATRAEKMARSAADLQMDLAIAAAKQKGNDKLSAALEREKKIRADQRQIMNDVGLAPAAARDAAEKLNPESGKRARKPRAKTIFDSGFNEFFHPEETKFGQRSKTGLASQSFNDFFHRRDPQRQTAEARAARSAEKQVGAKDPLEVMKAQLNALEKLASY